MAGTIKHSWEGTVLTIESDSGISSCDLKGDKGDTGIRGPQGATGEKGGAVDSVNGKIGEVELKSDDVGAYSLADKGTAITKNADLNTYTTPGNYYASTEVAKTVSHSPFSTKGYRLICQVGYSDDYDTAEGFGYQIAFGSGADSDIRFRSCLNGSWTNWLHYSKYNHYHSNYLPINGGNLTGALNVNGAVTATTFNGDLSGNASTATKLTKKLTIGSTNKTFDGSADISLSLNDIGALPGKTISATTPATEGWYRIATTIEGQGNNLGQFIIQAPLPSHHCTVMLNAGISYGNQPTLQQMNYTYYYNNPCLTKARIVYHPTYTGTYAYLEVYLSENSATEINVTYTGKGWNLISPNKVDSTLPSGYMSEEITFVPGIIAKTLTISGTEVGLTHIKFSRPNVNYIVFPKEGAVSFECGDAASSSGNGSLVIRETNVHPGKPDISLRTSGNRWANVFTKALDLSGTATMTGQLLVKNDPQTPLIKFMAKRDNATIPGAYFYEDFGSTNTYVQNQLVFRVYSIKNDGSISNTSYENFKLPGCNLNRTGIADYNILTTKNVVTLPQGGTGATTPEQARINLGITPENIGALPDTYVAPVTSVNGQTGDVRISVENGLPLGGTKGQVLGKKSDADNDIGWINAATSFNVLTVYPVGSIYMSVNNVNPATLFGGTWEQIQDAFLLAAGTKHSAGSTGGSETYNLSVSHKHMSPLGYNSDAVGGIAINGTVSAGKGKAYKTSASEYSGSSLASNITAYYTGDATVSDTIQTMPPYLTVYMWKRVA